jgi:DNA mismatch repair protein MutS
VAKLAGLPAEVLARARELLKNLEAGEFDEAGRPRLAKRATGGPGKAPAAPAVDRSQLGLFGEPLKPVQSDAAQAVLAALESFSVDTTTPLEALTLLSQWKQKLKGS